LGLSRAWREGAEKAVERIAVAARVMAEKCILEVMVREQTRIQHTIKTTRNITFHSSRSRIGRR
jgi:hypothetical protein